MLKVWSVDFGFQSCSDGSWHMNIYTHIYMYIRERERERELPDTEKPKERNIPLSATSESLVPDWVIIGHSFSSVLSNPQ